MSPGEYERMSISAILQELDAEIARLQQAKHLLLGMTRGIPSSGCVEPKAEQEADAGSESSVQKLAKELQKHKGSVGQPERKRPSNEARPMLACWDDYNPLRVSRLAGAGFDTRRFSANGGWHPLKQ